MPRGRPAAPAPPTHRRDGVVERIEVLQEWRKDGKARLKNPKRHYVPTTLQRSSIDPYHHQISKQANTNRSIS